MFTLVTFLVKSGEGDSSLELIISITGRSIIQWGLLLKFIHAFKSAINSLGALGWHNTEVSIF